MLVETTKHFRQKKNIGKIVYVIIQMLRSWQGQHGNNKLKIMYFCTQYHTEPVNLNEIRSLGLGGNLHLDELSRIAHCI